MADRFLNTTGSNTSPYDTWAKAATAWSTVVTGSAAGDRFVVDTAFNTSVAGIALTFPGTPASPNQVLSVTPTGASGISSLTAGALCLTSNTSFSIVGSLYAYGITFQSSSGSSHDIGLCTSTTNVQILDTCSIISGSGGSSTVTLGATGASVGSSLTLVNTSFKFGAVGQTVNLNGEVFMLGGTLLSGGSSPTNFFNPGQGTRACKINSVGFDFNNCAAGFNICSAQTSGGCTVTFSDFKLPASFSGALQAGTTKAGCRSEFYNGDNAATGYRFSIADYPGTATESASIYLTGTLTDGVAISDKIVTSANVKFPAAFKSRWLYAYDAGAGSAKTATVQCARDGSATKYNDDEVWLEVECLGTSSFPLGVFSSDRVADVVAAAAAQATGVGTGSWSGLSGTACSMALAASYTPRNTGYVRARVCMAVPSATLYYDPVITLT